jgi:hypothetical protein
VGAKVRKKFKVASIIFKKEARSKSQEINNLANEFKKSFF